MFVHPQVLLDLYYMHSEIAYTHTHTHTYTHHTTPYPPPPPPPNTHTHACKCLRGIALYKSYCYYTFTHKVTVTLKQSFLCIRCFEGSRWVDLHQHAVDITQHIQSLVHTCNARLKDVPVYVLEVISQWTPQPS